MKKIVNLTCCFAGCFYAAISIWLCEKPEDPCICKD